MRNVRVFCERDAILVLVVPPVFYFTSLSGALRSIRRFFHAQPDSERFRQYQNSYMHDDIISREFKNIN